MKHLLEVPIYSCLLFCTSIFVFVRGNLLPPLWAYMGFTVLTTHLLYRLRQTCVLWIKTSFVRGLCQSFQSRPFLKGKYVWEGYMSQQQSHVFASRNIFPPCKFNISRFQSPSPIVQLAIIQLFQKLLCLNWLIKELSCNSKLHSFVRKMCILSLVLI